jgi:hypothetical protein
MQQALQWHACSRAPEDRPQRRKSMSTSSDRVGWNMSHATVLLWHVCHAWYGTKTQPM